MRPRRYKSAILALIGLLWIGCTAPPVTDMPPAVTCAELEHAWGNWPASIDVLEALADSGASCGEEPISSKLYAAYFNHGMELESAGYFDEAVIQYRAALALDGHRDEALKALLRLNALPAPTPAPCLADVPPVPAPQSPPDVSHLIRAEGTRLFLGDQPFQVRGVNYYPRHAPWDRFIAEMNLSEIETEFSLIEGAGFNTLRVFLWYEALFTCAPEQAVPLESAFAKIDALFDLAAAHHLKLIVTLNDLPDLYFRPLYTDFPHYDAQTAYIVQRYRSHAAVLAWDMRNEGDLDYGARGDPARFTQDEVIGWLAHVSEIVRTNDPNHLITAGWWGDPAATEPYVDVLSFHHWASAGELNSRITAYQANDKPLLLEEVGYHSWSDAPIGARDDAAQAQLLDQATTAAEAHGIAGWLVWSAFDFTPKPGQPLNVEHFFGLWTVDLQPKPALEVLR